MKPRSRCLAVILLLFACVVSYTVGLAVMSIDMGSEFMKIAIVKPGVPMEIVLNKESNRKTPSIVSIRDDGERTFGEAALNTGLRYPKTGYRYLMNILGKQFDNPLVQIYRETFPFYELEKDERTGTVLFKTAEGERSYSVEELLAMMLQKDKEYAETFAEQPITECVITVPSFFNQAERRAMNRSAELAGLKVLQLINDNTAVALNYGVFRRSVFNTTAVNYMFFDMGASSTTATIVSYQVVKVKLPASGVTDTFPQLTIRGVGFDRTLGGAEFQHRLTDHLATLFNGMRKKKGDVRKDVRAMQKLYKEAGRVKQVLSANADHFAQVEGLSDEEDFRAKVTREEFETICADLFPRIKTVVKAALDMSQMTLDEISEVILMGGGTRVPRVQATLQEAIQREELGKGINSDEAAALGAVYQAANLGKGFKVKKFGIKDATIYPIQVEFKRVKSDDAAEDATRIVNRTLFGRSQSYPQKKVMTFNKHVKDFGFEVNYGDLSFLTASQLQELGATKLQSVSLTGVEDAYTKHGEGAESKGVKAHFRMDDSGLLYLDKVECQFEKEPVAGADDEQSTLSKIGNTISNLFGRSKSDESTVEEPKDEPPPSEAGEDGEAKEKEEKDGETEKKPQEPKPEEVKEEKPTEESQAKEDTKETEKKSDAEKESAKKSEEKKEEKKDEKGKEEEEKKEKKLKPISIRADIKTDIVVKDVPLPTEEQFKDSKKLISDLHKKDEEKTLLEKAKNEIESLVFDFQDKLEQREYKICSTEEERISITEKLTTLSDWLNEQDETTPRKEYENKLKDIKKVTHDLTERVKELKERPAAVEALNSLVNHTEYFLTGMKNYTGPSDEQPFTKVEFEALEKLIKDTKEWNKTVHADQAKTPLTQKPIFTVEDLVMKMSALDREVKYLIGKAKLFRPKPKPKEGLNKTEQASTRNNETKSSKDPKLEETLKKIKEEAERLDRDILNEKEEDKEGTVQEDREEAEEADSSIDSDKTIEDVDEEQEIEESSKKPGRDGSDKPPNDEL